LAETIRQRVSETGYAAFGVEVPAVTISAGVAAFPANGRSADALLHAADNACYRAKLAGRNRVHSA
jgi:diguanylate cyclase (GGDEF)-like protein